MGYSVTLRGRVQLDGGREADAVDGLRTLVWRGEDLDGPAADLGDLAAICGSSMSRDGDVLVFQPDAHGDPKWSDRASAFYGALSRWVTRGEIQVTGEDGAVWSYIYNSGEVTQVGVNGYDGSTAVAAVDPADATLLAAEQAEEQLFAEADEPAARLSSNRATLCCANPTPASFGHPAPWTAAMSAPPQLPLASDAPTDTHGLFYLVSILDSDDRSAKELGEVITRLEADEDSVDSAAIARQARETRMIVGATTAMQSFSPEQLARIVRLQIELDALLIHEEVITYRTSMGTEFSATIRF